MNNFINGFRYVLSGFSWICRPKIRRFVYIPLIVNTILLILAFILLSKYAPIWVAQLLGEKSDWWVMFQWTYDMLIPILTLITYVSFGLLVYFSFSSLANLLASPFNAQLSKAVEQRLAGQEISYTEMPLIKEIFISIRSELAKTIRFIFIAILLLISLLIPGVNLFFPLMWFVFMAYTLSLQYIDYPMANHQYFYREQRQLLKKHRATRLGFGSAANLLLFIPFVNFLAMPVCVCGATIWWHDLKQR